MDVHPGTEETYDATVTVEREFLPPAHLCPLFGETRDGLSSHCLDISWPYLGNMGYHFGRAFRGFYIDVFRMLSFHDFSEKNT